jgi:hypothetical protein
MSTALKLAGFAAVLALVFGVATVAGGAVGPDREGAAKARAKSGAGHAGGAAADTDASHGGTTDTDSAAGHEAGADSAAGHSAADPVRGLAVSDRGLRLSLAATSVPRGRPTSLRFAIRDARGPVRDFEVEHEKRMHLIVVRRDGRGFQHVHPTLDASGTWSVPITLPDAGAYRVFADFKRGGRAYTLAADLTVDGDAAYAPLPAANTVAETDGYTVKMRSQGTQLGFAITRDGKAVKTQPYLGAGGHLVALREGDLAFLHVHPTADDRVEFETELQPDARYRLYLQFKHDGRVHTAEFTR